MLVFVVDSKNNIGHPTRNCRMVRRLLKKGKAILVAGGAKKGQPIVIKLLDKVFDESKSINAKFRIEINLHSNHNPAYVDCKIYKIDNNLKTMDLLFSNELETRTFKILKKLSKSNSNFNIILKY